MMRNLVDVIDAILDVAPDLQSDFADIKSSAAFMAPEMATHWWRVTMDVLNTKAVDHPKNEEIRRIFNGQ